MASTQIIIDPSKPIDLNIVVHSPHKVAFRFWTRAPGATPWQLLHGGKTGDEVPDHKAFSSTKGTAFAYWIGVGGNPGTNFRVIITLAQGGAILANGTFVEQGTTDAVGVARAERQDIVFA